MNSFNNNNRQMEGNRILCTCKERRERLERLEREEAFRRFWLRAIEDEKRLQEELRNLNRDCQPIKMKKEPEFVPGKWIYWKRVVCENGKEKLLKTSKCPVPKPILYLNKHRNEMERRAKEEEEYKKCKELRELEKAKKGMDKKSKKQEKKEKKEQAKYEKELKELEKRNSAKRESIKHAPTSSAETANSTSVTIKRKKRDSIKYEEEEEKEAENEIMGARRICNCGNRQNHNQMVRFIPCQCANNNRVPLQKAPCCGNTQLSRRKCPAKKKIANVNPEPEYKLVVQVKDREPCVCKEDRILEIIETPYIPPIQLYPIDPCEPLPPCQCRVFKERHNQRLFTEKELRDSNTAAFVRASVLPVSRCSKSSKKSVAYANEPATTGAVAK